MIICSKMAAICFKFGEMLVWDRSLNFCKRKSKRLPFFKWFYDHRSSFITIKFYFHLSCKVGLAGFKEDTHLTSLFLWSSRLWNARRGWHYCSTESAKNASTTKLQSFKILVVCCFILKQLETVWQAIKSCKGWLFSAATSAQGDG